MQFWEAIESALHLTNADGVTPLGRGYYACPTKLAEDWLEANDLHVVDRIEVRVGDASGYTQALKFTIAWEGQPTYGVVCGRMPVPDSLRSQPAPPAAEEPCLGGHTIPLTEDEYAAQMSNPDATWRCPFCGGEAQWDDGCGEDDEEWPDPDF